MADFRIIRGEPDAEELAAVTAVLCALLARARAADRQSEVQGSSAQEVTAAPWTRTGPFLAAPGDWMSSVDYPRL